MQTHPLACNETAMIRHRASSALPLERSPRHVNATLISGNCTRIGTSNKLCLGSAGSDATRRAGCCLTGVRGSQGVLQSALPQHATAGATLTAARSSLSSTMQHEPDVTQRIARSLDQLQLCAANLDADPTPDGLLTTYQQLQYIQKQILQEQRACQAAIHRARWHSAARSRRSTKRVSPNRTQPESVTASHDEASEPNVAFPATDNSKVVHSSPVSHDQPEQKRHNKRQRASQRTGLQQPQCGSLQDSSQVDADGLHTHESAQLQQLKQLRLKCDDAQDFIVGLVQMYLQDQPPSGATRLLTLAASRQLNIAALNNTCVHAFLDKQQQASPSDMAGLMAALSLVRCCSKHSQQVEGLDQHQLAALFSGTMTHLLAHVEQTLSSHEHLQQQQQQQLLQQHSVATEPSCSSSRSRTRRASAAASQAQAAAVADSVDVDDLRRQVAAGVAAHVTGRVPVATALIPHIRHILSDQAPAWLHPITELQAAGSITQLQLMLPYPARYDFTYLAAAVHRLAELVEQQQHVDAAAAPEGCSARVTASRLARKLYARLQQLLQDATAAELACVLQAACQLSAASEAFVAAAAVQFATGPQLQQATDAQIASVMYSVAVYSSSSSSQANGWSMQQRQSVLKACGQQMCRMLQQQQQQRGSNRTITAVAAAVVPEPSTVVMAVWALATTGCKTPKTMVNRLFGYLGEQRPLAALTGSTKATQQQQLLQNLARNCCTVIWAAAQLQYMQSDMGLVKAYLAGFMRAVPAVPVSCSSMTTVLQAVASLLSAAQWEQQQLQQAGSSAAAAAPPLGQQQQPAVGGQDSDYWRSIFLRCSEEVLRRLQQQQQQRSTAIKASSSLQQDCASDTTPRADVAATVDGVCPVSAASQVVWAYQVAGFNLPDNHISTLLQLFGDQAPSWLVEDAISRASTVSALLQLLQSRAAATAADLSCIAAALKALIHLQTLPSCRTADVVTASAAARNSSRRAAQQHALAAPATDPKQHDKQVKQCRQQISLLAGPLLQQHEQPRLANKQPPAAAEATAATAASILWATAQLQHRDSLLSSHCLHMFHDAMHLASQADAAAVVTAMASPGRLVQKVYSGCSIATLQTVLRVCTARLLGTQAVEAVQPGQAVQAVQPGQAQANHVRQPGRTVQSASTQLAPQPQQRTSSSTKRQHQHKKQQRSSTGTTPTQQASSEGSLLLSADPDSVQLAQRLLQLHAVLQLTPSQQQLQQLLQAVTDESSLGLMDEKSALAALVAALGATAELSQLARCSAIAATNQQQQVQVQQLLQELLLDALLPRITRATAKQIVTSVEAVVTLAVEQSARPSAPALLPVERMLAQDFTRGVLTELLAPSTAAAATSDITSFLSGWSGEHVASLATAALKLGVADPRFFEAVASDVLLQAPDASDTAVLGSAVQLAAATGVSMNQQQQQQPAGQNQQQRRRSQLQKVQLHHLAVVCCCAAASHCRVPQLLTYTFAWAAEQLQAQKGQQQQQPRTKTEQQQQLGAVLMLLLAWSAAVMDVPQLLQPAQELLIAAVTEFNTAAVAAAGHKKGSSGAAAVGWMDQNPGLAARLFQTHIWLADRQWQLQQEQQLAVTERGSSLDVMAGTAVSNEHRSSTVPVVDSQLALGGAPFSLSDILSPDALQSACNHWLQLQIASSSRLPSHGVAAVADALQQLPAVKQLQMQSVTSDGWLVIDLEARVQDISLAVLVMDDSNDYIIMPDSSNAFATQHNASIVAQRSTASNSMSVLHNCLCQSQFGDVMFRARALAARGFWVVVLGWQQWMECEGSRSAELACLQSKLWLLHDEGTDGVDAKNGIGSAGDGAQTPGGVGCVTGMPVTAAVTASVDTVEAETTNL